ncbi:MAG: dihydrolipoyl dehydrogenase [Oceanococcus sp.]
MKERVVDVAIIGGGTAGMAAYREVTKLTNSVALIEGGPFGTTCARVGCMPSKLLIAPAEARHRLQAFPAFGMSSDVGAVDGVKLMQRVREERDRFVGFVLESVDSFKPEHIIRAYAQFEDAHTLRLSPADPEHAPATDIERVRAQRIIIAAGSRPMIPDTLKPAGDRLIVNDDVFYWQDLPKSVAVFGTGVIGLELGQALHRLGVRVRLFGRGGRIGGLTDPVVRDYAGDLFAGELPYSRDTKDVLVEKTADAVQVSWRDGDGALESESFEYVLAATGRVSNTDKMVLKNSALELDAGGVPVFDPQTMQAGSSHIFIAGDVIGVLPLLHEAADEGRLAGENAAHFPAEIKRIRRTPLAVVFSDPNVAFAGQSHAQLIATGVDFAVGEVSFENQGRSRVMLVNKGLLHVYGERGTGRLLGAEMIGPANEHLAHLLAWAIQAQMTTTQVLEMPFYHPVIEEGLRTALRDLHANLGHGPQPPLQSVTFN